MTLLQRLRDTLRGLWCRLNGGHYRVRHTAGNRLMLRCVSCQQVTPGWETGGGRFRRTLAGDPKRLRLTRP